MLSLFRRKSNSQILQKNNHSQRWQIYLTVHKKLEDTPTPSTMDNQSIMRASTSTSSDRQKVGLTAVSLNEPTDLQENQNASGELSNKRYFPGEILESERKKRKFEECLKMDNNDEFDEDYHFAMSILPFLTKMEEIIKLKARMEIIEIITRELGKSDQEQSSFAAASQS